MASGGKLEVDVTIKSAPKTLILGPDQHDKIEIQGGHGKAVGSICLFTHAEGPPLVNLSKERMEVSYRTVIESDLLKYYKKCTVTIPVTPKGDESLVKWMCEYGKASEDAEVTRIARAPSVVKIFLE